MVKTLESRKNLSMTRPLLMAKSIAVRVSPGPYLSAMFVLGFFSSLLLYLEYDTFGSFLLAVSIFVLPPLAFFDRIVFNGRTLRRTGLINQLWSRAKGRRRQLRLRDIEQVDSQSLLGIRRGGKVTYRHRTTFKGKGLTFSVISGGKAYYRLVRSVLPKLDNDVLDAKSTELRDYLKEPATVLKKAKESDIPPPEVLENSMTAARARRRVDEGLPDVALDVEKASKLRTLANELRVSGALLQALEAFRRAVRYSPSDGWLLFEFARCLQAFARTESDPKLRRRSVAMMRLAERRAGTDGDLLARLGECYVQVGDPKRAAILFRRIVDGVGENFRAVRGLAEIALSEGKIAHVIHNFASANRNTNNVALRRWTKTEMEYFSRLQEDDEYMDLEISRVNLLDSLIRARGLAIAVSTIGLPLILGGILVDSAFTANVGWIIASISVVVWSILSISQRILTDRIPFDMLERE